MSDGDRREKRTFQPPPWEEEAFKAFEEKRAEKERQEALLRGAVAADVLIGSIVTPELDTIEDMAAAVKGALKAKADQEAAAGGDEPEGEQAVEAEAEKPPTLNEKLVAAMMLELAQDERTDGRSTKIVAWVAAGVTAVVGLAMVIFGLVLAAKAQGQGSAVIGSAVLVVFGFIFGGMAVWVWLSSNRVRGR